MRHPGERKNGPWERGVYKGDPTVALTSKSSGEVASMFDAYRSLYENKATLKTQAGLMCLFDEL